MPGDQIYSVSQNDEIYKLMLRAEGPVRAQNIWNSVSSDTIGQWNLFSWAQLFVPIFHQETLYGVLLLGDRVTGNIYSNQDLQIIGTVGQQAALSIANISLVEALRGLTQQLVRSDEEQRKRVARELHDTVLQNLFFIKQRLARSDPEAADSVDQTITMLRQIIKAQRPSLLDRGLTLALQDLINDMEQLAADDIVILWHNGLDSEIVLTDEKATSIYRIVQESLVNVLKHAHADQVIVTARRDNDVLVLQIEDDGIGISKENHAIIFDRFNRLDSGINSLNRGHGLGLSVSKAIIDLLKGKIQIESELGKGACFTLIIPESSDASEGFASDANEAFFDDFEKF